MVQHNDLFPRHRRYYLGTRIDRGNVSERGADAPLSREKNSEQRQTDAGDAPSRAHRLPATRDGSQARQGCSVLGRSTRSARPGRSERADRFGRLGARQGAAGSEGAGRAALGRQPARHGRPAAAHGRSVVRGDVDQEAHLEGAGHHRDRRVRHRRLRSSGLSIHRHALLRDAPRRPRGQPDRANHHAAPLRRRHDVPLLRGQPREEEARLARLHARQHTHQRHRDRHPDRQADGRHHPDRLVRLPHRVHPDALPGAGTPLHPRRHRRRAHAGFPAVAQVGERQVAHPALGRTRRRDGGHDGLHALLLPGRQPFGARRDHDGTVRHHVVRTDVLQARAPLLARRVRASSGAGAAQRLPASGHGVPSAVAVT
ncbi:hypothetical protein SAMN05444392_104118 [Seinonella peptonophila]|uniref:Uncharacterized protein n=1 Tax=Seinonella peptonophila TaxID=112248 RepID=A0A1M4X4I4_9BACL|nr:hypothetical protein SAMN05444392_104118 [Seinonella peptonophila]